MKRTILTLMFCAFASSVFAAHLHLEKWYQEKWCAEQNGKAEVVLPDRTRCDCLTDKNAIEFDFGKKWAEAIGAVSIL